MGTATSKWNVFALFVLMLATAASAQESPSIRLMEPQFNQPVPIPRNANPESSAGPIQRLEAPSASQMIDDAANGNRPPLTNRGPNATQRRTTQSPPVASSPRRRVRLARAPNMFGDFFNETATLNFVVPQISFSAEEVVVLVIG